jgi:hypothetical protein
MFSDDLLRLYVMVFVSGLNFIQLCNKNKILSLLVLGFIVVNAAF